MKDVELRESTTPDANSPAQNTSSSPAANSDPRNNSSSVPANPLGERVDGNAEEEIARLSMKAWRTALAHDKRDASIDDSAYKKQRASDEKDAMAQLEAVEKKHPAQSTVLMMKGQVLEHFGKHQEAVKFYKEASKRNLLNTMSLFKAAEAERKSGQTAAAIKDFRTLMSSAPGFPPAQVGLAQCLLEKEPGSPEAKRLLQDALQKDPTNPEVKQLLSKLQ